MVAAKDYAGRWVFSQQAAPEPGLKRQWVEGLWRPWHRRLAEALDDPAVRLLLDGHSLDGVGPAEAPDPGAKRADVVLSNRGDQQGQAAGRGDLTCPPEVLRLLGQALEEQGLSVAYNTPYVGGHIIVRYGPSLMARGAAAVQMELNKDLYADPGYSRVYSERAAELSLRLERALRLFLSRWR